MNKNDFMKLKGQLVHVKGNSQQNREPTELEEIFVNYISDKRLIFIIHKELKKTIHQKNRQPNKKWVTYLNRSLPKEDI